MCENTQKCIEGNYFRTVSHSQISIFCFNTINITSQKVKKPIPQICNSPSLTISCFWHLHHSFTTRAMFVPPPSCCPILQEINYQKHSQTSLQSSTPMEAHVLNCQQVAKSGASQGNQRFEIKHTLS